MRTHHYVILLSAICAGCGRSDGSQGAAGTQGPAGSVGPAGVEGPAGASGSAGARGPQGGGVIWKDAKGTSVPVLGTLPFYAGALNEGATSVIFLYADAVGHVWGLYPRGIPGPPLFAKEYYATTDCTGQAYMFGVPARYIVGVSGSGGTELGALKDNATSTMVLAQSTGIPAQCSLTNMNAVPMFATTTANMDLDIAVDTPAYQLPLHPQYIP